MDYNSLSRKFSDYNWNEEFHYSEFPVDLIKEVEGTPNYRLGKIINMGDLYENYYSGSTDEQDFKWFIICTRLADYIDKAQRCKNNGELKYLLIASFAIYSRIILGDGIFANLAANKMIWLLSDRKFKDLFLNEFEMIYKNLNPKNTEFNSSHIVSVNLSITGFLAYLFLTKLYKGYVNWLEDYEIDFILDAFPHIIPLLNSGQNERNIFLMQNEPYFREFADLMEEQLNNLLTVKQ